MVGECLLDSLKSLSKSAGLGEVLGRKRTKLRLWRTSNTAVESRYWGEKRRNIAYVNGGPGAVLELPR